MKVLFYGFKVEKQNFVIVVVLALCSLCTDFFGLILCFQNYTFNGCKINGMSQYVVCLEYSYVSIYNKALRSCIYIYMLAIANQTAGPNWLTFFREPIMGALTVTWAKKFEIILILSLKIQIFQIV